MDMIRVLFAAVVLATIPGSVSAQVSFGPERPLSSPVYAPSYNESPFVRAASDGKDFLVVWNSSGAARVTAAGDVLDVPSLLLPQPQFVTTMDVVWDGSHYMAGWPMFPFMNVPGGLYFSQVNRDGGVKPGLLHISTEPIRQNSEFHLAANGGVIAAAYQLEAVDGVGMTLFREDGTVINTIRLTSFNVGRIVARGTEFAVQLDRSVALISDLGVPTGEIRFANNIGLLDFAFDASGFVVAAREDTSGSSGLSQLVVLRVSRDGSALSRVPLLDAPERIFYSSITEADGETVVGWKSSRTVPLFPQSSLSIDLWTARIDRMDRVVEKRLLVPKMEIYDRFVPGPYPAAISSNGSTALLVWTEPAFIGMDSSAVNAIPIHSTLGARRVAVSQRARDQMIEAVAPNGANFLVVWYEGTELRSGRITPSGKPLDGEGIVWQTTDFNFGPISAAFDGEATVVVWEMSSGLWTVRVMPDGVVAGPPVRVTADRPQQLSLSCASAVCLAAWNEGVQGSLDYSLSTARIRRGIVVDVGGVFFARGAYPFALATSGDSFLLVTSRNATPTGTILSASRIGETGNALSVKTSDFVATNAGVSGTRVLWDGVRYVAIWEEGVFPSGLLRASRISPDGDSLDGDATSWRGLDLMPVASSPDDAAMIGRSVAVSLGHRLLVLSADTLQQEQDIHIDADSQLKIVGQIDGTGMIAYTRKLQNAAVFHATRAFCRVTSVPVRTRAVRRH